MTRQEWAVSVFCFVMGIALVVRRKGFAAYAAQQGWPKPPKGEAPVFLQALVVFIGSVLVVGTVVATVVDNL